MKTMDKPMRRAELVGFFAATWGFVLLAPHEVTTMTYWGGAAFLVAAAIVWWLDWYSERLKAKLAKIEKELASHDHP